MLSGTSIIEWHIKKQMYERKYIVCLVSFLIMCFCLRVKRCDCGGGSCFVWGRKWQLGNSGYAMVSKERHNRNAGTATTLPTQHTTTYLHLPSYQNSDLTDDSTAEDSTCAINDVSEYKPVSRLCLHTRSNRLRAWKSWIWKRLPLWNAHPWKSSRNSLADTNASGLERNLLFLPSVCVTPPQSCLATI